jgi:hypothetical protein
MGMQIRQYTTARRKVTLTMSMSVQSVSHACSQGEKCFQREKTVSIGPEMFHISTIQYSDLWLQVSEVLYMAIGIPSAEPCS